MSFVGLNVPIEILFSGTELPHFGCAVSAFGQEAFQRTERIIGREGRLLGARSAYRNTITSTTGNTRSIASADARYLVKIGATLIVHGICGKNYELFANTLKPMDRRAHPPALERLVSARCARSPFAVWQEKLRRIGPREPPSTSGTPEIRRSHGPSRNSADESSRLLLRRPANRGCAPLQ